MHTPLKNLNQYTMYQKCLIYMPSTAHSFVELVRYLLSWSDTCLVPGVKVFLSRRLCQDPLEKFFGCQRQRGSTHDNPTFEQNTQSMSCRLFGLLTREVAKGNCRSRQQGRLSACAWPREPLVKEKAKQSQKTKFRVNLFLYIQHAVSPSLFM